MLLRDLDALVMVEPLPDVDQADLPAFAESHGSKPVETFKVRSGERNWTVTTRSDTHRDRVALIREIAFEFSRPMDESEDFIEFEPVRTGNALSLNISSGGMLLLMAHAPEVERVLRVHVPTPVNDARTPTLAEVRWVRHVPLCEEEDLSFVGVKFLF